MCVRAQKPPGQPDPGGCFSIIWRDPNYAETTVSLGGTGNRVHGYSSTSLGRCAGPGQVTGNAANGCSTSSSVVSFKKRTYVAVIAANRRCSVHSSTCRPPLINGH